MDFTGSSIPMSMTADLFSQRGSRVPEFGHDLLFSLRWHATAGGTKAATIRIFVGVEIGTLQPMEYAIIAVEWMVPAIADRFPIS